MTGQNCFSSGRFQQEGSQTRSTDWEVQVGRLNQLGRACSAGTGYWDKFWDLRLGQTSRLDWRKPTKLTKHQQQSCSKEAAGLDEMKRFLPTSISVGGWKCLRNILHLRVLCVLPSCSFLLLCSTYVKQQLPEVIQEGLFPRYVFLFLILLLLTSAELHTFAYRKNVTFWQ